MNSRKPNKQSLEQVKPSLFDEPQLQLAIVVPDQNLARKARPQATSTYAVRLPPLKGRTLH